MINNKTMVETARIQNNRASPLATTIQNAFNQLQTLEGSKSTTLPPDLLQHLFQTIQKLLSQLESQSNTKEESVDVTTPPVQKEMPPTNNDQPTSRKIVGSEDDDTINGTRNDDTIHAQSGNDRVNGRQGRDTLLGQQGNDRLYGGKGDDQLEGGAGNDYLAGGRGNNTLLGGEGDDTLYTRLGSDILDGGEGNDTARIRANIDEYTLKVIEQDSPDAAENTSTDNAKILLTHKETGQTIEAVNIEKFRFDDVRLSLDEIKQRATDIDTKKAAGAEAIDKLFDLSSDTFDSSKKAQYEKILNDLYSESPSFKRYIDKGITDEKKITLELSQAGSTEASHGLSTDGKNFSVTINENDPSFLAVYDLETNTVNLEQGLSVERTLVHEVVHSSLGLGAAGDGDLTQQFKTGARELDAYTNFQYAEEFKADLEARRGEPLPDDVDVTSPETLDLLMNAIGPGEIVRLTNQIFQESDNYKENPRASFGSYSDTNWDGVPYIGNVLNDLYNDDLAKDDKLDLLYLTLNV